MKILHKFTQYATVLVQNRAQILHYIVQGVSHWNVLFELALRGRRIINLVKLLCLVASVGVGISVSYTSLWKSNIGWPQQPLTEKILKSVINWIFDDTFHKKRQVLVILVPGMIQPSRSVMFLAKWGCKRH